MKRPRWLGSGESKEEKAGDDDVDADSPTDESEKEPTAPSAAERSARRTAQKSLGARVKGEEPDDRPTEAGDEPEPKDEPRRTERKDRAKPKPRAKAKPRSRPKIESKREVEEKSSSTEDDESEKKQGLNRPKRQGDGPSKRGAARERSGASDRTRARARGKSAKQKRKPLGRRVRGAASGSAGALKRGAVETRRQIRATAPKLGGRLLAALGAVFAVFFEVLGFVLNILIAIGRQVARPVGWVLVRLGRLTDAASRQVTPVRVLALVVAGGAILLALSQYADYRSISIGNDAYSGVQTVAPAPETARVQTGDAHSYVFVPIGIVCLLLLGGALTGRWRLCRLIALAGAAAIVVALVVDRPTGLDTGDTALAFDGVRATLLGGFYAQIAAGILLICSSSLLARELRLAGAAERTEPERRRKRAGGRALPPPPADAGGVRA